MIEKAYSFFPIFIDMFLPYGFAVLGGLACEKSGVVNIALEGTLLWGAFGLVIGKLEGHYLLFGVFLSVFFGLLVGFIHSYLVVMKRVDAIVSGVALNLLAVAMCRFFLRTFYHSSSNSPSYEGEATSELTMRYGFLLLFFLCAFALSFIWKKTRLGLIWRAVGENTDSARKLGISVKYMRMLACTLGGGLCAFGGSALAFSMHQFQSSMTGGRGYIALAAVIASGWRVGPAVVACMFFTVLDGLQLISQGMSSGHALSTWSSFLPVAPYVITLGILAWFGQKKLSLVPSSLGKE